MSDQQTQTLEYFHEFARDWKKKASGGYVNRINVIAQRNNYALRMGLERRAKTLLDVGCGTGELVIDAGNAGIKAKGIDFAPAMIDVASAAGKGTQNVTFSCESIFDYQSNETYDLIVANGFIEYISSEEYAHFLNVCRERLNPGGALVMGSRNRLFNLFSLNDYSRTEFDLGTIEALMREAILLANAESVSSFVKLSENGTDLPAFKEHANTGIGVQTRYQFTPSEVIRALKRAQLNTVGLAPMHYQGVPPSVKAALPHLHFAVSESTLQQAPDMLAIIPQSSTFMVCAE